MLEETLEAEERENTSTIDDLSERKSTLFS